MLRSSRKSCKATKGTLILNVNDAKIPGVVRVDLSALPFTHFHVRSGAEGSVLGYNDAAGNFTALALFGDRADADKALAKIETQLMSNSNIGAWLLRAGAAVLAVIVLLYVLNWIAVLVMAAPRMVSAPQAGGQAPVSGMPMDADSKFSE